MIERSAVARDALERLRGANEETVLRLSKAVEYRDPETGSHIERMSHYCALLAASSASTATSSGSPAACTMSARSRSRTRSCSSPAR